MSERTEKKQKKNKTANCLNAKANEALITLVTRFDKDFIDNSFDDVQQMFLEWVSGVFADDQEKRESYAYSMEMMLLMGKVVKAISKEIFEDFGKEAEQDARKQANEIMDKVFETA